jgi:hypothetical protein
MTGSEPKFIGKRISVRRSKGEIHIAITQQIERWQEATLVAWILAWLFCGVVIISNAFTAAGSMQIMLIVVSSLWLYFFVRVLKAYLWRKLGREIIVMRSGKMSLKNAFGQLGKTEEFNYQHIFKLGLVKRDPANFFAFLDDSFWVIGGERIGFNYSGQKIRLGKQLSIKDAELLIRVLESGMRELKGQ